MLDEHQLMIFCWLEAIRTERLCRKSTSEKKTQIKASSRILETAKHCKTKQDILRYTID